MMARLARLFALVACLVTLQSAWAGDVLDRIAKTNTLRVGMTGTQPPFTVRNKEGELMGMDVDLAKLLANTIGVKLDLV